MGTTSTAVNMVCATTSSNAGTVVAMTSSGAQTTYSVPAETLAVGPGGHAYLGSAGPAVALLLPETDEYVTFPLPIEFGFDHLTFDASGALWGIDGEFISRITFQ
jgi:streptogramin lyase